MALRPLPLCDSIFFLPRVRTWGMVCTRNSRAEGWSPCPPRHQLSTLQLGQLAAWHRGTSLFKPSLLHFLLFVAKHNSDTVPNSDLEIGNQRLKKRMLSTYLQLASCNKSCLTQSPRLITLKIMPSSISIPVSLWQNWLWTVAGPQFFNPWNGHYYNFFYPNKWN